MSSLPTSIVASSHHGIITNSNHLQGKKATTNLSCLTTSLLLDRTHNHHQHEEQQIIIGSSSTDNGSDDRILESNCSNNYIVGKEEDEIKVETSTLDNHCSTTKGEKTPVSPANETEEQNVDNTLESLCIEYLMKNIENFSKPPSSVVDNNYYEFLEKVEAKLGNQQAPPQTNGSSAASYKHLLKQRARSSSIGKVGGGGGNITNYLPATFVMSQQASEEVYPFPQAVSQLIVNGLCTSKQISLPLLIKLRYSGLSNLNLSLNGRVHDDWMMLLREIPLETLNLSHCLITNQSLYYVKGKKHIIPCPENETNNERGSPTLPEESESESESDSEETQKKSVTFSFDSNPNRKPPKKKKKKIVGTSSVSTPHKRVPSADSNGSDKDNDKKKKSGPKSTTSSGSGGSGSSSKKRKDGSIQVTTPYTLSRTLKSLNMSNIHEITHDSFKLIPQLFPNLTALSFEGCSNFTNKCLEHICGKVHKSEGTVQESSSVKQLRRNLKKLNLKKTKISDAGVRNLQSLINLEYLNLSENKQLTNHCLKFLKDLKFLSFIAIDGNERMTEDGLSYYLGDGITGISISGTYMGDNPEHFANFPKLNYWNASNTNIHSLQNNVKNSFAFNNLSVLNLSHCKLLDDNSMKKFFESLNCLCEVNISSTFLDDEAVSGLLSSKSTLKILHINNCVHITDLTFEHILPSFNIITELGLRQMKHITYANGWCHLFSADLPKVEKLYLTASFINQRSDQVEQEGFKEAFANICKNLKILDLSCNLKGIDDENISEAISAMTNLEWIDFSHCDRISSKTVENIAKHCFRHLTHFAISYCKKVDGASIPLLRSCKSLEVLYLSGINILPQQFAKLATLENISDLSVMDCKKLEQRDGCTEFLYILSNQCKFKNKLLMLNLYGLYIYEDSLGFLVSLDNLVTLRLSTHEELEDLGALYDLHNLVYLKTNVLQSKSLQQDYKASKGFNREVFSI
ncbi:leucine rich repeat protein with F-box domain [Naegleria gruberi]|uniref:Leucine rich repeat protein with F-box domain n=1 Tax=Naegleria gruberi TaxID=5762 RepID=D2W430_NAEGR|nr:leucine rich repeat protein with F-box domain [Naegleria gruberi]EFC36171.1 leucine rich repeat protein with F-box domain [Naegleria gruberi]|eukprot:XP_002668915.1 leucine rich repeat protein with F-box domain [Naegleria gruberi strain NEG-M]